MLGFQQAGAFGKRPAGVLATVPFVRADGGEKMLHRCLVAGEQLAVEVTGIPVDQDAAEIEHNDITGRLRHRSRYSPIFRRTINIPSSRSQSRDGLG